MSGTGFNVKSGILAPEHRDRMGIAIWEFLWCIDKVTREYMDEDKSKIGLVLGGKPIDAGDIANDLGTHPETVKRNLRKLSKEGYLRLKRTPYGSIIEVSKSGKWYRKKNEPPKETSEKHNKPKFVTTFEQEFARPISHKERELLQSYIDDGLPEQLVEEAIIRTKKAGKVRLDYTQTMLNDWLHAGYKTLEHVAIADQEFQRNKKQWSNRPKKYGQANAPPKSEYEECYS